MRKNTDRSPHSRTGESPLRDAISDMLRAYRIEGKFQETRALHLWEEVMGPTIARRTTELDLRKGTLYVRVNSAALRHELAMGKQKIINLLNSEVGNEVVSEVIFL